MKNLQQGECGRKPKRNWIPIVVVAFLIAGGCAGLRIRKQDSSALLDQAIAAGDLWWTSIRTEDPHYYEEIDLGRVIVHLCGSRATLWAEYNTRYPDQPMDLASTVYMFTCSPKQRFPGAPAHVWMVVKTRSGKILLHKWAAGHELIRVLSCFSNTLLRADQY